MLNIFATAMKFSLRIRLRYDCTQILSSSLVYIVNNKGCQQDFSTTIFSF